MSLLMRAVLACSLLLIASAAWCDAPAAAPAGSGERLAIPKSLEQEKAEREVRERYKKELASRDPRDQVALARRLRTVAETEDEPAMKFVLLREARELAIDGGDFRLTMDLIDEMGRLFAVDAREMKGNALSAGVDKTNLPPAEAVANYLELADDAIGAWDLNLANKAAYAARKVAGRDKALLAQVTARDQIILKRNREFVLAKTAEKKLSQKPDDPQANGVVGRHLCFNVGQWETGLPYLAKGPPGPVTELAKKDLALPTAADAEAMAKTGDAWWDVADAKPQVPAGAGRRRAVYWYEKAVPGLEGQRKADVAKRLGEAKLPDGSDKK